MSYKINKTDGTLLVDLIDGTINTESSDITLIGRNYKGFGELINENFVKMLENFASSSAPANPLRGQLWYDTSENRLKVYNGTEFSTNGIIVSATQPNLAAGDIWIDSLNNQMKFFDGADLVLVGPIFTENQGVSGFVTESKLDTQNQTRTILKFFVGNTLVGVWSAAEFTPVTSQLISELVSGSNPTGIIYQGFNLTNTAYKYRGIALKAESLIDGLGNTILADSLLRSDANDITTGTLKIQNNGGLTIGLNDNLTLKYGSVSLPNASIIKNNVSGSDISFNVSNPAEVSAVYIDATTYTTSLTTSTGRVGIFNTTPTRTLDIAGDVRIQGNLNIEGTGTSAIVEDLRVEDKTIELATITGTPLGNDSYVSGGGIVLKSSVTDKTLLWQLGTTAWTSSENINLATGKEYKINGVTVLSATALGSTVASAPGLTSLGTLTGPLNVDNLRLQGITLSSQSGQNLQLQAATNIISIQGSARITGLGLPTAATDAARKDYVDGYLPIGLVVDITGFSALSGGVNGSIIRLLTDLYKPDGYTGAGLGIPVSAAGRIARVHTVEFGSLTVNIPGANIESALDESFTAVDQTLSAAPNFVLSVQTVLDVVALLDSGHIRITTPSGHFYEVGNTVTITGSSGTGVFAPTGFDGTYTVAKVIENALPSTQFDIDISATIPSIDSVSGALYTPSSAAVSRTPQLGNSNKTVLQDVAFGPVTGAVSTTVSRGLKQFIVVLVGMTPTWTFHSDLTSTV
jgi:hypothetical protein